MASFWPPKLLSTSNTHATLWERAVTFLSRWQGSTDLHNSSTTTEAKSAESMPLTQGRDVADVDVDAPGTAVDAEVVEAEAEAEETLILISLTALM